MDVAEPPTLAVPNERIVRTYDVLSGAYDRLVGPLEAGARSRAIDLLAPEERELILEVGCGPGRALTEIASRTEGGRVYGLDAAPGMLSRARRRCKRSTDGDRLALLLGDARRLPFRESTIDAVYIEATLELFSPGEMRTVLREIHRVLAPAGRLCAVTMEREGFETSRFVRAYEWFFERAPGYQSVGCRPVYARRAIEDAGFTVRYHERDSHVGVWPVDVYLASPT